MPYLDDLVSATRARITDAKATLSGDVLDRRIAAAEPPRGFAAALRQRDFALIAEIKRASPRTGPLRLDLDAGRLAADYAGAGAAALSVLTEPDHFRGSLEDLQAARSAALPVLRKDFILEPFQVFESRAVGADAILVIVRVLGPEMGEILAATASLGMDALVEVHDETDLERALDAGAALIGVNHRDLETFEVDPDRTAKLAPRVPQAVTLVALSGVSSRDDIERLRGAGAHAALVGEALVTSPDPGAMLRSLLPAR